MKTTLVLLMGCLSVAPAPAQKVIAVQLDKMNVLYRGVGNPVSIAVEDQPGHALVFIPSVGRLEQKGLFFYNWYICDTDSLQASLYAIDTVGRDTVQTFRYRVRRLHEPRARWGGRSRGGMRDYRSLAACGGISLAYENADFDVDATVLRYRLEVYCAATLQSDFFQIEGPRFTEAVKARLKKLSAGDWVRAYQISYRSGCDVKVLYLNEALFYEMK